MNRLPLFALAVLTGCALEGRTMGTQLAQGRDIDAPFLVWAEQRPLVLFDRLAAEGANLHATPFDGQGAEVVWAQMSTRTTWQSASGYLVAEQPTGLSVFSLLSTGPLRSTRGTVVGLQGDELLFSQGETTLLLHLPSGEERDLGKLAQLSLAPDGRLYYLGKSGILRSFKTSDDAPEAADRLADRFIISADQTHAVMRENVTSSSPSEGETRDRLLRLPSLRDKIVLPLADRGCAGCVSWLGFSPDGRHFYYAENRRPDAGIVYQLDVQALEVNQASPRPGPGASDLLWSPAGDVGLLGERPCAAEEAGCRVLYRSLMRPGPSFAPLHGAVAGVKFFPSGRYLLFEDAMMGGRLMVAAIDALSPEPSASARLLTPQESLLDGSSFDADTDSVVFWARPMAGKSSINLVHTADRGNLYAATAPDFAVRRLAEAVDSVAVGQGHALALVRFSPQDLTGDLVLYDLGSGQEQTLAAPVSAFWVSADCPSAGSSPLSLRWQGPITRATEIGPACPDRPSLLVTFVVRGRVKSDKDGLWSLTVSL